MTTIPVPAGHTKLHDWEDDDNGHPVRYFSGRTWPVEEPVPGANQYEEITIKSWGSQSLDGVERAVDISNGGVIALGQALKLAEALIEAVDEAKRMNELDNLSVPSGTVSA
jgi:hypothetical protein